MGEQQTVNQNTREIHREGLPDICGQHNLRATIRDNTEQNTDKRHTPSSRIEIKISDPAGNRTRVARFE